MTLPSAQAEIAVIRVANAIAKVGDRVRIPTGHVGEIVMVQDHEVLVRIRENTARWATAIGCKKVGAVASGRVQVGAQAGPRAR